jgi:hypothetical protein
MTTKHTAGEWTCMHGDAVCNHITVDNGRLVLAVVRGLGTEAGNANARLIAAAPDMAEALRAIVAGGITGWSLANHKAARAALEKAGAA